MSPQPLSSEPRPARWVLVTGGARRLGREIGLAFARAGWGVAVHYRHSQTDAETLCGDIAALGGTALAIGGDLAHPNVAQDLLDQLYAQTDAWPDCVVNNASAFDADDAFTTSAARLHAALASNTVAPLMLANTLAARLKEGADAPSGQGSVVHVLDQKVHNLNPDYFSYTVSKLALAQSVALQAQALAPWLRVCGLSPGLMYPSGPQSQANFDRASRFNLQQQAINPAEVARCALFIAENSSLNGTIVQADNGQHLVALNRDVMFAVERDP